MKQITITPQKLFLVSVNDSQELVSEKTLEFMTKYYPSRAKPVIREELGVLSPEVEVFEVGGKSGKCYSEVDYKVISKTELSESDFRILRAQGYFLTGQGTGVVRGQEVVDGLHVYMLRSMRDSSD